MPGLLEQSLATCGQCSLTIVSYVKFRFQCAKCLSFLADITVN